MINLPELLEPIWDQLVAAKPWAISIHQDDDGRHVVYMHRDSRIGSMERVSPRVVGENDNAQGMQAGLGSTDTGHEGL